MLRVHAIPTDLLGRRHLIESLDLSQPGDSGPRTQRATASPTFDDLSLRWQWRPRSNETHVPPEDVEQLRKFIEVRAPQNPTYCRWFEVSSQMGWYVPTLLVERAELADHELAAAAADAGLAEEDRSTVIHEYRESDDREERPEHRERCRRDSQIEEALPSAFVRHGHSRPRSVKSPWATWNASAHTSPAAAPLTVASPRMASSLRGWG